MAFSEIKERFFKSSSRENSQKVPFCEEIRDFIAESYKCQTLYANCEGFYPKRVISCHESQLLKQFIIDFMYYNEDDEQSQSVSDRMIHASQICDKMISLSKNYRAEDKIHFSVVWVYYFEYELRIIKATPVFKIFKTKSGTEAVFLDVLLNCYESWDSYLENAEFMESFLCVPRNGEYHFDRETKKLVLEYVRSMKLKTSDEKCLFNDLPKMPFSQKAVRTLFTNIKFMGKTIERIKRLLNTLLGHLDDWKGSIFNVVIFVLLIWRKLKDSGLNTLKTMHSLGLMLLNEVTQTSDYSNLLKVEYWIKHITPEFSCVADMQKSIMQMSDEGARLYELLLSDKKDWSEILKLFCSLFRNTRPTLTIVSFLAPELRVIQVLFWILCIIEKISVHESDNYEIQNVEFNSSRSPGHYISTSSALDSQDKLPSTVDRETQTSIGQLKNVSFEEILSVLPSLEDFSSNAICNSLFEKSKLFKNEQPWSAGFSSSGSEILIGRQNGYGIYIFPSASITQLTWFVHQLLKTDLIFKPEGIIMTKIISRSGITLGYIFSPLKFTTVGLFPLEAIKEEEENLQELLLEIQ